MRIVALAIFALSLSPGARADTEPAATHSETPEFGGTYDGLSANQARLIDDWCDRYAQLIQEEIEPEEAYNTLPLSIRTTYEAVTNALDTTKLTGESGKELGTALELIEHIEAVRGKVKDAGGDRQFRMYARLVPAALDRLEASKQFERGRDNSVYHKGYPINYRQQGGTPSMQFSVARGGKRADVDVDYRSSKFPNALFNGHLTSSNSDVRAGSNHNRHSDRWSGLEDWWRGWFGLPLRSRDHYGDEEDLFEIPDSPRKGKGKAVEAAHDFLHAWLVEGKPNQAVAYFSVRAVACMAEPGDQDFDFGVAPVRMLLDMKAAKESLGPAATVADVTDPVFLVRPGLKRVKHDHDDAFTFYKVPERLGEARECSNRDEMGFAPEYKPRSSPRYGKYYGAAMHLSSGAYRGASLYLLWAKDEGTWRIVSYKVEPEEDESAVIPDLRTDEGLEFIRVKGDPKLIEAALDFHSSWFVTGDYAKAVSYLTDESDACVDLYLEPGEAKPTSSAAYDRRLELGLQRTVDGLGLAKATPLEEAIEGIAPVDPVVHIVEHENEEYFTLLDVPDFVAEHAGCEQRLDEVVFPKMPANPTYGNYYASAFRANIPGEPTILHCLWAKRDDAWKVIAYHIEEP